jgi:cytochrome b6-f complex iron-sulfur subunit
VEPDHSQERRSFLNLAVGIISISLGILTFWGLGRFSLFSTTKKKIREVSRDLISKLKPGVPWHVPEAGAWLVLVSEHSKLKALNDRCPHLGCRYAWNAKLNRYHCPCHGSEFDIRGKVLRGPATKPIESLQIEDSNKDFIRFRENRS